MSTETIRSHQDSPLHLIHNTRRPTHPKIDTIPIRLLPLQLLNLRTTTSATPKNALPILKPNLDRSFRHPYPIRDHLAHLGIRTRIHNERLLEHDELFWGRALAFFI